MDTSSLDKEVIQTVVTKAVRVALNVQVDLRLSYLNELVISLKNSGHSDNYIDSVIKQRLDEIRKEIRSESDDVKRRTRLEKQSD